MPATRLFGRRWQVSTDVFPLLAIFSAFFYVLWLIYIVVAYFITVDIHGCNDPGLGRHYLATVTLFFTEYVCSLVVAVCIAAIGLVGNQSVLVEDLQQPFLRPCKTCCFVRAGTPLEASRRKIMIPFRYLQVFDWLVQLGCLGTNIISG